MDVLIGFDVSLSKTSVCAVDRDGVVLWQGRVASDSGSLIARLGKGADDPHPCFRKDGVFFE